VDVDGGNPVASVVTVDGTFTVGNITIDAGDSVVVGDSEDLSVSDGGGLGAIVNNGNLTVDSTGDPTDLSISGMIGLSGSGVVTMSGNAAILGSGTLTSASVIQGQGNIGNYQIAIVNDGLINANATGADLIVAPASGADTLVNSGTMQASAGGILVLDGNGGGSFGNTGGVIQALGGSEVELNNAAVTGGTLATAGSGELVATDESGNFLSGVTVSGNLDLTGGGIERVLDGLVLSGTATIDGGGILDFQETQALSGTATVLFGSNTRNALAIDSGSTATLTLDSGVLIHGQNGTIGQNAFTSGTTRLINDGTIAADVAGGTITVLTNSTDPASVTNAGTLEAINGGTLAIDSNVTNTGVIQAGNGTGVSELDLSNAIITQNGAGSITVSPSGGLTFTSTELIGGTLTSAVPVVFSSGSGNILSSVNATLSGMTLTSGGAVRILNGGLTLNGTATIDGGGILAFQETQSLNSDATIVFGSDVRNALAIDAASSAVLTLGPNVLVHGQNGTVGDTAFTPSSLTRLINDGTIAADNGNGTITIQTTSGDSNSVTNNGTLEAINGGTLAIQSNVTNNGVIQAGNGIGDSTLSLQGVSISQNGANGISVSSSGTVIFHNSQVDFGTLNSAGSLYFTSDGGNILNSVTATVAGMNLSSSGIVRILNGGLTLNGTANIDGGGVLGFQETQTLNGDATILFGSSAFNRLAIDSNYQATLTFNPNVLVHGQNGTIGTPVFIGGSTKLINDGTIAADVSGGTISVNTTSSDADSVANYGTLEALNGGTLALDSNVTNNSTMEALGGGTISINGSTVSNPAVIQIGNGAGTSNLDLNTAGITQTGTGAITISSGGGLTLNAGQITDGSLTSAVPLSFSSNSGNILSSVNATVAGLNLGSSGIVRILNGGLTLNGTANINGGGVLGFQETQTLGGSATILFGASSFNRLAIDSSASATLTFGPDVFVHGQNGAIGAPVFIGGSTKLINYGTIAADVSGGTISLNPSSSAADSVENSGTMEATNGGTLAIDSNLSNGTTLEAINGGTLVFNANVTNTGTGQITVTGAGSAIDQNGVTITGGVINQSASGSFVPAQNGNNFLNGVTVDGDIDLTAGGDERVLNGLVLNGIASIDTGGVLDFQETQMLSGSGTILFGSSTFNRLGIDSSSTAILTLGPNILVHGQNGTIGESAFIGGTTKLVNDGTIAADGAGGTINIETSSGAADSVSNNGTIEATNFGTITLSSNLTNSGTLEAINSGTIVPNADITNTGAGEIDVSGAGSSIEQNGITITGGVINQSNSGSFMAALNGANCLNGVTVNGNISLADDGEERVLSGLVLNGTATIDAGGVLDFQETQTLSGSATILFGPDAVNRLGIDSAGTATLTLGPDVLVHGQSGIIGQTAFIGGTTKLINNGTISADGAGGSITIETTSTAPDSVNNAGTLEAANGGTLIVMSNVANSGTFEAFNGSSVAMQTGDLLANDSAGVLSGGAYIALATGDGATVTLQGGAINEIAASTEIELSGPGSVVQFVTTPIEATLTFNDGTLAILNNRNYTNTNSLENGGTLQIGGGLFSAPEVTNDAGAQVHGYGTIFISGATDFINNGTISADVAGGTLTLDTSSTDSTSLTNNGTLEAINGGALAVNSNVANTGEIQIGNGTGSSDLSLNNVSVAQSGAGAITVSPSGGMSITNSGISGGTLTSAVPVIFSSSSNNILSSVNATLGGINLTGGGIARIINGSLTLNGTANIDGGGILAFQETQMLSGSGTILFGANTENALAIDSNSSATLTLGSNVYIHGQNGTIGGPAFIGGTTKLINNGVISADVSGGTITLNPTSTDADSVDNAGTLEAANGGALNISSNLTNTGAVEAFDGSSITMTSGALLANDNLGVLTGGVYAAVSTGDGATATLGGSGVTQIAAGTEVILSGAGSVVQFGGTPLENSLTANYGTLEVLGNRNFIGANSLENSGTLQLSGGTFTDTAITNDVTGEVYGFGTITPLTTNNGLILATGGLLTMSNGIQGSGTIEISPGANLDLSDGSTVSSADYLIHNGANLNLGGNNIFVADDYNNANFGTGNTFNPHANVTGSGEIEASGNISQSLSGSVSGGDTSAATLSFGNVHVGDVNTENYVISNSGSSGPLLRGAIQTSVNGGNVTDDRLSGSGVTAANWGPLATGSSTGSYSVVFDASSDGPLNDQSVRIINNFDNVAGQTIEITGTAYQYAAPGVPVSINLGNVHLGTVDSQLFCITNEAPDDGYSEALDAAIGSPTGGITTNGGSFNLLLPGGTNSTALAVGISTTTAGPVNGTATITLTSDGAGSSGLGTTALPSQLVNVSGTVYRIAQAGAVAPGVVNFGNFHIGNAAPSQLLTITNIAAGDGYSEALDAVIGTPTTGVTTNNGSFNLLAAGGTNSSALAVGISTAAPGPINGTATIEFTSDGAGTSGLGLTDLPSQTVDVSGTGYRLAQADLVTSGSINLGNVHVGTTDSQALTITNGASADGYSEALDAAIGSATGGVTTNGGSFNLLTAGGTNSTALSVGISTVTAGPVNGTATITVNSDGAGSSGLGATVLTPLTVDVSGTVYRLAQPDLVSSGAVNFGNFHVGDSVSPEMITLANGAAADGYSEALDASIGSASTGVLTNGGSFSLLAAGGTNNFSLEVFISTATAGSINGTATINLTSDGAGSSGLGTTALSGKSVQVSGTVYRLAQAGSIAPVNLGNFHINDPAPSHLLTLTNAAANDGYSEDLDATMGSATGGVTTNGGSINLLTPGGTNSTVLAVGISTSTAGAFNGTATIDLTSDGQGTSGLGSTTLAPKMVSVSGTVYRYAQAAPVTPGSVHFGNFHVDDAAPSRSLTISNIAANDGFSESLDAVIGSPLGAATTNDGSVSQLSPGGTDSTALTVGISTATAGAVSGTATISFASDGAGSSGLGITGLPSQTVSVSGAVYRLAEPELETPGVVNFGNFHIGDADPVQSVVITNGAAQDGYSESLDATIGSATGGVTTNGGSINLLAPGGTNSTALAVGISTAAAGAINGTASIDLTSDGAGSSGLGTTALAGQIVDVSGTVYRVAQAAPVTPVTVNLGIVHVGDNPQQALTIANTATADGFSEKLDAQFGATTGGVVGSGSLNLLAAGGSNSSSLLVGVNTIVAGSISGTATVTFLSDGAGTSGLGLTALQSQTVSVSAQVNNFANALFLKLGGDGVLTQTGPNSFTLNLGVAQFGGAQLQAELGVENNAAGPADTLAGSFDINAPDFTLSGFNDFAGITAGQTQSGFDISIGTSQRGGYSDLVTLLPESQNTSGYNGSLGGVELTLEAQVVPEPSDYLLFLAGCAALFFARRRVRR
jgi:hypothetical protein